MSSAGKVAVAVAVVAVAGAGLAVGYQITRSTGPVPEAGPTTPPVTSAPAPVGPADGTQPAEPTQREADPTAGQTVATDEPVVVTGAEVPVTVTFHGYDAEQDRVVVGGYVTGVVEDGGTCTLTLTRDGRAVTAETEAVPDAATTACGAVTVPGDQVEPGTWQAVLSYSSAGHVGTSGTWDIEVRP